MSEEQTEQAEQTEQIDQAEDGIGASLISSLFASAGESESQEENLEPEAAPEVAMTLTDALAVSSEPEPEAEDIEPAEPEKEPESDEQVRKLDSSLFESRGQPQPTAEPAPEPDPAPEPELDEPKEDETKGLTEDQLERLSLAEYAESNFEEHKGLRDEYIQFFKEQKEYIDQRIQEDPDAMLDDTDHEYQSFLNRKKPKFDQRAVEKVVESRTRQSAKREAIEELTPELNRLKEEQRQMRLLPQLQAKQKELQESVKNLVPSHLKEKIETDGFQAAYDSNPMEYEIINKVATRHQEQIGAFHEISLGVTSYNPENPAHVRLATWVEGLQATMPSKDSQGREFVPRESYDPKNPNTYTLTNSVLIQKAEEACTAFMNKELGELEDRLRKAGFTRGANAQSNTVAPAPKPTKPTPRQGHTTDAPTSAKQEQSPLIKALGL
jgi:hypothetical protein